MQENKDQLVERVKQKFDQRSLTGLRKYGHTMEREDLTTLQWLIHLQEELMDGVLYSQRLIEDLEKANQEITVLGDK